MPVSIGGKVLGAGQPVFIVFEAGPTHDGLEAACRLIDVAADAGADAVKFQIVDADSLVPDRNLQFSYQYLCDRQTGQLETVSESLWEILKRRELSYEEWDQVIAHCRKRNIAFFSTATNAAELDYLASKGVETVKICSGDITYHHLLRLAAKQSWSVQVDTGGATLAEVEQGIEVLERAGCENIIINHCPSGYPARLESINLRVLSTLQYMYPQYVVAFSDHTQGRDMDVAAVALGAHMIEKTITLDRTIKSPEHVMSLEPHEAKAFVQAVRDVETGMGTPRRLMADAERKSREIARRSLYAARSLEIGTILSASDISYARPGGVGISAEMDSMVLGKEIKKNVNEGAPLAFADFA